MEHISINDIITNEKMSIAAKTKILYLQFKKETKEIAQLLNCSLNTVRCAVRSGGYSEHRLRHKRKYLDVEGQIRKLRKMDPTITRAQLAIKIGCSTALIGNTLTKMKREEEAARLEGILPKEIPVEDPIIEDDVETDVDDGKPPYEIIDWPYVFYNGRMCQILTKEELKERLIEDGIIIPKGKKIPKKKPQKSKTAKSRYV